MRDGHLDPRPDRLAAIVLAGGRARRLGGVDKPMVAVGGVPMLGRVLRAVADVGAAPIVVVGPEREGLPAGVRVVREEPAGGGPVAAAAAGMREAGEGGLVALLAADLPFLGVDGVRRLVNAVGRSDGAVFVDGDGQRQYLCGVWRVAALREALRRIESQSGRSMRALVAGLDVVEVRWEDDRPPYFDCDTADDLQKAEQESRAKEQSKEAEPKSRAKEQSNRRPRVSEDVVGRWLEEAAGVLGIAAPSDAERQAVLDLARDVAHNVARPGAPLTAFLLGIAVGQGADLQRSREALSRLAVGDG